jgi:excinuclease ABC subunit A
MRNSIFVKGAREHNLKNVDLEIPRDQLVVLTGLSGSGKSSLAFDTIYAEGQRRYVESLSSYARQFLGQLDKPDVDYIDGLSPAIAIDQKTTSKNPRSTVGTVTEIYDYLRLLWARIGIPHCPRCGKVISQQSIDQIVDQILLLGEGTRILVMAPLVRGRKGEYEKLLDDTRKSGYARVRVDGSLYELSETIKMDKNKKHDIEVVVDRLVVKPDIVSRLTDSVETSTRLSEGTVLVSILDGEEFIFSQNYACDTCGISIEELSPRLFSFNNPTGACPDCSGLGVLLKLDPNRIIPDMSQSLAQGAVHASGWNGEDANSIASAIYRAICKHFGVKMDTPLSEMPQAVIDCILYGSRGVKLDIPYETALQTVVQKREFEGIIPNLERRYKDTASDSARGYIEEYMSEIPCETCHGKRLGKTALSVTVSDTNISDYTDFSVDNALAFLDTLVLSEMEQLIGERILKEIRDRLGFLKSVGLSYLCLSRHSGTLSGGESQRIRLATQIGSSLMGVLYILDEPSIGLHQRDNEKLLGTLKRLRDLGNTVLVVEHDEETMLAADYIVDVGPGAGIHGGHIIAQGTIDEIRNCKESVTGQYLRGEKFIAVPKKRRTGNRHSLVVKGAREHNLKNINITIPLGTFTCVTGVSGSGKSSFVNEILYKALAKSLNRARSHPGAYDSIQGIEYLDKVIDIDQSPIGRTPRSNPGTYIGLFSDIRTLFATTVDAKARGYSPSRFSFNVKGGRCEACSGDGLIKKEMNFLPDVYVPCDVCKGKRYNRETLEVHYKGLNIYEVLELTAEEGVKFFANIPKIARKLETMCDVGLGYVKLGQPSTTLSGGEAQRVKLATELSKIGTGKTIYILDEPTTGLHVADVDKLLQVLNQLVDRGNTMVVIEHNLDVIKTADYVVDLGPEGGDAGGEIIVCGTPEQVADTPNSYTGQYLKSALKRK